MDKGLAEDKPKASGLSIVDLNQLSDSQRQLVNWMRRKGDCSWQDIITQMGEDESTVRTLLDTLLEKGFVREISEESGFSYRVNLGDRRGRQLPLKLQQALEKKNVEH